MNIWPTAITMLQDVTDLMKNIPTENIFSATCQKANCGRRFKPAQRGTMKQRTASKRW